MNRWLGYLLLAVLGFLASGIMISLIARHRMQQSRVYCANNLRQLAFFAAVHAQPPSHAASLAFPDAVPPGTVLNHQLQPAQRLSWFAPALLVFDQRIQETESLYHAVDFTAAWDQPRNQQIAQMRLTVAICYGNPPEAAPGTPALTSYVGMAGIGEDAAELPRKPPISSRAGCWSYHEPTPFSTILDGLSHTILYAEHSRFPGPWLQGGPATVRAVPELAGQSELLGPGRPFAGNHPLGGNFALADGSVRWLENTIDATVFANMTTIAGADGEPIPGE
jgi:prepilin-type processing-associated H-X9-DG protein